MKNRLILLLAVTFLISISAAADDPVRQTIVVKDGKLLRNGQLIDFDGEFFGFSKTWLGVSLIDVTPELRGWLGAPRETGVLVSAVAPDSPAAKAGLRAGDVILALDGKEAGSASDLRRGLREKKGGDSARLEIIRDKNRQALVATLVERDRQERMPAVVHLEELSKKLGEKFDGPEWKARLGQLGDCGALQSRIRDLETRLNQLERKLQK